MSHEIVIRRAVDRDIDAIIELLKISLGEGTIPRVEEYWKWKHQLNTFGPSPVLLAESRGQIVGLRTFMRWGWSKDGTRISAVRAVDTATHPDWQGRGIFKRLTLNLLERMKEEDIAFVFNTPNQLSMPGYLKMGWQKVGRPTIWFLPSLRVQTVWGWGKPVSSRANESVGQEQLGDFPVDQQFRKPELESLISSRASKNRLSTQISTDYLKWRYVDVPMFRYHAAARWNGVESVVVVFRVRVRGRLTELRICEVLAHPRSIGAASNLLLELVGRLKPDITIAMAARHTPEIRALVRAGFLPAPRSGPTLTVRMLNERCAPTSSPMKWSSWRTSIGDLELF